MGVRKANVALWSRLMHRDRMSSTLVPWLWLACTITRRELRQKVWHLILQVLAVLRRLDIRLVSRITLIGGRVMHRCSGEIYIRCSMRRRRVGIHVWAVGIRVNLWRHRVCSWWCLKVPRTMFGSSRYSHSRRGYCLWRDMSTVRVAR